GRVGASDRLDPLRPGTRDILSLDGGNELQPQIYSRGRPSPDGALPGVCGGHLSQKRRGGDLASGRWSEGRPESGAALPRRASAWPPVASPGGVRRRGRPRKLPALRRRLIDKFFCQTYFALCPK